MAQTQTKAKETPADDYGDDELPSVVEFSEDITDAEAPDPLPATDFNATIRQVEPKTSQNSGNRYAAVSFFIPVDDYPADYDPQNAPDGTVIIYRRVPLEDNAQARFRLRRFCEAIGAPMSKRIDVNTWVGLDATCSLAHETYEGIPRAVITRVSAPR